MAEVDRKQPAYLRLKLREAEAAGDVDSAARLVAILAGQDEEAAAAAVSVAMPAGMTSDEDVVSLIFDLAERFKLSPAAVARWLSTRGYVLAEGEGTGDEPVPDAEPVEPPETRPAPAPAETATPGAMKLLSEHGLCVRDVSPMGGVRITRPMVEQFLAATGEGDAGDPDESGEGDGDG